MLDPFVCFENNISAEEIVRQMKSTKFCLVAVPPQMFSFNFLKQKKISENQVYQM
jgi:hypothetical protein